MAKALSRFTVEALDDEQFLLRIEDADGDSTEVTASFEQLDLIQEAIDEHLDDSFEDEEVVED